MAEALKISSDITGLRMAKESVRNGALAETSIGGTASIEWLALEPNTYADFGGDLTLLSRSPINPSRQRKKGVITDLEAAGGFNQDVTFTNFTNLWESIFLDEGVKRATSALRKFTKSMTIARVAGELPILSGLSAAEVGNTMLDLEPGDWLFIGGDPTASKFTNAHNNGFARIESISAAGVLTLDKTSGGAGGQTEMENEGPIAACELYFGTSYRNVSAITNRYKFPTWAVERTLGKKDDNVATTTQSEEITGAALNEFNLSIPQADKVAADVSFVASRHRTYEEARSVAAATAGRVITPGIAPAYNTSEDVPRIRMAIVKPTQTIANRAAPIPLFGYVTSVTLNINNNVTPDKAVGVLGAFDVGPGTFEVGGDITAYFTNNQAIASIIDNADITLDIVMLSRVGAEHKALLLDIPLIALGGGRLNVAQGESITIPLSSEAAEYDPFGYTLKLTEFNELPEAARS